MIFEAGYGHFSPNVTPEEMLRGGAFGGTAFRCVGASASASTRSARNYLHSSTHSSLPSPHSPATFQRTLLHRPTRASLPHRRPRRTPSQLDLHPRRSPPSHLRYIRSQRESVRGQSGPGSEGVGKSGVGEGTGSKGVVSGVWRGMGWLLSFHCCFWRSFAVGARLTRSHTPAGMHLFPPAVVL